MDNDVTKKLDMNPLGEDELDQLRKRTGSLEDMGQSKDIKNDRLERFNKIKEKLKSEPLNPDVDSELRDFKNQSKLQGHLGELERNAAAVPNPDLNSKLADAANSKRLEQLSQKTASSIPTADTSKLPLQAMDDVGDVVKDIDLNAYRASKLGNVSKLSRFAQLAEKIPMGASLRNAAKIGGKAALKAAGPVSALFDLLNPEEANAGADMVPGRPSFEQLYGEKETPEQREARIKALQGLQ